MSQTTLKAALLGIGCFLGGCTNLALGFYGAAALAGIIGAAIPAGVLYVRFVR